MNSEVEKEAAMSNNTGEEFGVSQLEITEKEIVTENIMSSTKSVGTSPSADFEQKFSSETKTFDTGDEFDPKVIAKFNETIPWRLCFAGGWMDLEWCNKIYPGPVITVNVKYNKNFKDRAGLATSTRKHWIKIYNGKIPSYLTKESFAKTLWGSENMEALSYIKKGKYLAGSQDHIGLAYPGINYLYYNGQFWPEKIKTLNDINDDKQKKIFKWLESVLYLVNIKQESRPKGYNSQKINYLKDEKVDIKVKTKMVKDLADASELVWDGINNMDIDKVGKGLTGTMLAWKAMLPATVPDSLDKFWKEYDKKYKGCLFSGAGGGFLFVISDKPVKDGFQIEINNEDYFKPMPKESTKKGSKNNKDKIIENKFNIDEKYNDDQIPYNNKDVVDLYINFHYNDTKLFGVNNFAKTIADIAVGYTKKEDRINVIDVGCATGRTSFELSKEFKNVVGIDYAKELINIGNNFKKYGVLHWKILNHGEIYDKYKCEWSDIGINKDNVNNVKFYCDDAHYLLNKEYSVNTKYNCMIACNLIDRLSKPMRFLTKIKRILCKNGILIIVDPYTWLDEYTNKNDWIGGKIINGNNIDSFDELTEILNNEGFKLLKEMDVEFVIRETVRKYQHTKSHCSIWKLT